MKVYSPHTHTHPCVYMTLGKVARTCKNLSLYLKVTREAQPNVVWDVNWGACVNTRTHTDIYFVIYIQRNFDFKRLIGLIDSDYIL